MESQSRAVEKLTPSSRSFSTEGKPHVLVDARKISDGGIGVYTQNVIAGMLSLGEVRVSAFGSVGEIESQPWSSSLEQIVAEEAGSYSFEEYFSTITPDRSPFF